MPSGPLRTCRGRGPAVTPVRPPRVSCVWPNDAFVTFNLSTPAIQAGPSRQSRRSVMITASVAGSVRCALLHGRLDRSLSPATPRPGTGPTTLTRLPGRPPSPPRHEQHDAQPGPAAPAAAATDAEIDTARKSLGDLGLVRRSTSCSRAGWLNSPTTGHADVDEVTGRLRTRRDRWPQTSRISQASRRASSLIHLRPTTLGRGTSMQRQGAR